MHPMRRDTIQEVQNPMEDRHLLVRGDNIDTGRANNGAIPDLVDLHPSGALKQVYHEVLLRRFQVLDDDKSHPAVCRNVP
jgi:hypothetical protein